MIVHPKADHVKLSPDLNPIKNSSGDNQRIPFLRPFDSRLGIINCQVSFEMESWIISPELGRNRPCLCLESITRIMAVIKPGKSLISNGSSGVYVCDCQRVDTCEIDFIYSSKTIERTFRAGLQDFPFHVCFCIFGSLHWVWD